MAQVVSGRAHHLELADELVGRDQRLARDVTTPLGHDLVLEVRSGNARTHIQVGRSLDVEEVAVAGVHVDDDRGDLEVDRRNVLLGVTDRHRQLELAQGAHRATRAVGDLDRGVQVHVGAADVANGERVAAEIDRVEAVIHHQLSAKRVVDARAEDVGLRREELPQPLAGILVTGSRDFESLW
jgi:hypothetical protein